MASIESAATTPRSHAKQVLAGAGLTAAIQGSGLVITYATQILLARWTTRHDYGVYSYVWTLTVVLSTVLVLGLPTLGMKSVAAYNALAEYRKTQGFLRFSLGIVGVTTTIVAGIGIGLVYALDGRIPPYYAQVLPLAFAGVMPFALILLLSDLSRGFNWAGTAYLPKLVIFPTLVLIGVAALWYFNSTLSASMVLSIVLAGVLITAALNIAALFKQVPQAIRDSLPAYDVRVWVAAAVPMFFTTLFAVTLNQADAIIVGFFEEPESVAIYNVAKRIALLNMTLFLAINTLTAPRIAAMYAKGERAALQAMLRRLLPVFFLPSVAVSLLFLFFGERILSIFGQDYVAGVPLLLVLMLGYLSNAAFGPCVFVLSMTGHQTSQAWIMGIIVCGAVLLNLLLIPWLGTMGAALASTIGLLALNLGLWIIGVRLTGIDASIFCIFRRHINTTKDFGHDRPSSS